jgi:hypothetical protein
MVWSGFIRLRIRTGGGERSSELSGSVKDGVFFNYLSDHQFLMKDAAPWSRQPFIARFF